MPRRFLKKTLRWTLLWAAVLAFASMAWAEPYLFNYHGSNADILDGKAVYDAAEFTHVWMSVDDDTVATDEHWNAKGKLTVLGGNYSFWNGTKDEDVAGTIRTFDLLPDFKVGDDFVSYFPADEEGEDIDFRGAADDGLNGKEVRWEFPSLPALNGKAKIPTFRSTARQLGSYVPYVELVKSGSDITGVRWRIVDPKNPAKALPLSVRSKVRIRVNDRSNNRHHIGDWKEFKANEAPKGMATFAAPLAEDKLRYVQVRLIVYEGDSQCQYRWSFSPRTQSDAGVADWGDLKEKPFKLKAGETRTIKLRMKENFTACFGWKSTIVHDETVLSAKGTGVEVISGVEWPHFELKGLKPGKTKLSVIYVDYIGEASPRYSSVPVDVWVTDEKGNVPVVPVSPNLPQTSSDVEAQLPEFTAVSADATPEQKKEAVENTAKEVLKDKLPASDLTADPETGAVTASESAVKEAGENVVQDDQEIAEVKPLPILKVSVHTKGNVVAVGFSLKGSDLFAKKASDVQLLKITGPGKGELLAYTSGSNADGHFTVLDDEGMIVSDIASEKFYVLTLFIRDGGKFDLDGEKNGSVADPAAILSLKAKDKDEGKSEDSKKTGSNGGCNAGFAGVGIALLSGAALLLRKKS
ncbi:MAG: hypothetical protein GX256_01815 [Fretibacterium sp.]|nr:hypothetical protein [Fretibacterium sp.]